MQHVQKITNKDDCKLKWFNSMKPTEAYFTKTTRKNNDEHNKINPCVTM